MQSSDNSKPERRLEQLLESALVNDATAQELNELLRSGPANREHATKYLQFDAMLTDELAARKFADVICQPISTVENNIAQSTLVSSNKSKRYWKFGMSIAAMLLGVVSLLLHRGSVNTHPADPAFDSVVTRVDAPSPCGAAIIYEIDASWSPPHRLGDPISTGPLTLHRGVAKILFNEGAELSLDARSDPVVLKIDDKGIVRVEKGIVLAKVRESALGFTIHTPTTSVVDIGTEFGISIGIGGKSEIQVISGAVTCSPSEGMFDYRPSLLTEGSNTTFEHAMDDRGIEGESSIEQYEQLRSLFIEDNNVDQAAPKLIAHAGFDYPIGLISGTLSSGTGWSGGWYSHTLTEQPAKAVVRTGRFITGLPWLIERTSSYMVPSLGEVAVRNLASKISLDEDRDYYVSFLARKRVIGLDNQAGCGLSFLAADSEPEQMEVSFDFHQRLTCGTGDMRYKGGPTLALNQTLLIVCKIQCRRDAPDNLLASVYDKNSPAQVFEPDQWDCVGIPFDHQGEIGQVRFWCGSSAISAFDELKIGNSWQSVVQLVE